QIELASAANYDKLDMLAGFLDGVLDVTLLGGYLPSAGASFDILDKSQFGIFSGVFSAVNLPLLPAALTWDASELYTTGVLSVVSSGFFIAGDFDEDGGVDGDDLTRWQTGFGTGSAHMQGNADGDGDVDGADFLTWQRQVGSAPIVAAAESIPEPGALALMLLSSCGFAFYFARYRDALSGKAQLGDADGDNDSDGADFLLWQRQQGTRRRWP
ncbi:MAG: hypothetical protein H0T51_05580, partial [Pirellulales bacterium]|nr:hypothetical protein [Pirellulales bacterium]